MEYAKFIRFTNQNETCYAGETLRGEVVLTLDKTRKYKGNYDDMARDKVIVPRSIAVLISSN